MNKILFDETLRAKLGDLREPLQLCNELGVVIAEVVPLEAAEDWEPVTPEPTDEELDRLSKSNEPRYTTAEVLKYLEPLMFRLEWL